MSHPWCITIGMDTLTARAAPPAWAVDAVCKGMTSVFFHDHEDDSPEAHIEETEAKTVCAMCPVAEPCLQSSLDRLAPGADGYPDAGVFGGTSEQERCWLDKADSAQLDELAAISAELGPVGAIRLREWFLAAGPPMADMAGRSPQTLAVRYGVTAATAERWMNQAGVSTIRLDGFASHTRALLDEMSDGNWHDRETLRQITEQAVPKHQAENRAERRGWSEQKATKRIAQSTLGERQRYGQVEEYEDKDGKVYWRLLLTA